ncbi:MAG: YraN family protein [Candidatus Nanopelagicales bacterium]
MGDRQVLGQAGEDAAVGFLTGRGMTVVERNWRCRYGEVDIIAREGAALVFCEVKTRSGTGFGGPLAAITPAKQARLRRLTAAYLAEVGGHRGPIRIDALGLLRGPDGAFDVQHVRGAC